MTDGEPAPPKEAEVKQKPKLPPKHYVDTSSITNMLCSVLKFKYGKEADLETLLSDEKIKLFAIEFLTQFFFLGYVKNDPKQQKTEIMGVPIKDLETIA